jgi:hypothetical protein
MSFLDLTPKPDRWTRFKIACHKCLFILAIILLLTLGNVLGRQLDRWLFGP